jgi:hypothetical protein
MKIKFRIQNHKHSCFKLLKQHPIKNSKGEIKKRTHTIQNKMRGTGTQTSFGRM